MKIAYLVNTYPAPSHTFIRREIQALEQLGFDIERFSVRRFESELVDDADRAEALRTRYVLAVGVSVLLLTAVRVFARSPWALLKGLSMTWRAGRGSDRGLLVHLAYFLEACLLTRWCADLGIEHIHCHFGTNATTVAQILKAMDGPSYSFTVHGPEEFDRPASIGLSTKIEGASFVLAISSYCRSQLYRWCDLSCWDKIHVVHCGLDEAFLHATPKDVPDRNHLVCVGRLCEQKGQLLLVRAARTLRDEGYSFTLALLGDGEMRAQVEDEVRHAGLTDCVLLHGWASNQEVTQELTASRALVLASFAEGLPVVLMEALALGRPVISTWVAGIPELVEDGVNGWLIPAGSIDSLVAALRTVLDTPPEQLTLMGLAGARKVASEHDAFTEAQKIAAILRLGGTKAPCATGP